MIWTILNLTHLPVDKLASISQTVFWDAFSLKMEKSCILIQISLKFVPKVPINNNQALV